MKNKNLIIPIIVGLFGVIVTCVCLTLSNPHLWDFLFDGRGVFVYLGIAVIGALAFTVFAGRRRR